MTPAFGWIDRFATGLAKGLSFHEVELPLQNQTKFGRKLENWEDAATDAEIAQELDPSNVKVPQHYLKVVGSFDKCWIVDWRTAEHIKMC